MPTVSALSCLKEGWSIFWKRPCFFLMAGFIIAALGMIAQVISTGGDTGAGAHLNPLGFVIYIAISLLLDIGKTAFSLKAFTHTHDARLKDLWHPAHLLSYSMAVILMMMLAALGLFLLIVPGIFVILMLCFVKFIIVEHGVDPIEAMERSAALTKGHRWMLLRLLAAIFILNILGIIFFFVGVIVTMPVTMLALTHAYKTLSAHSGHNHTNGHNHNHNRDHAHAL